MKRDTGKAILTTLFAMVILFGWMDQRMGAEAHDASTKMAQAQQPRVAPKIQIPPDWRHQPQDLEPLPSQPDARPDEPPSRPLKPAQSHTQTSTPGRSTESIGQPWLFPDSHTRYLTDEDLRYLSPDQLWVTRNEIFARRGYRFHTDRGIAYGQECSDFLSQIRQP